MKLVAFDGDRTLWTPIDELNLSDRTPTDDVGDPDFSFQQAEDSPLVAVRSDGARFALRPEASAVLAELRSRGVLTGLISYNHASNVRRILGVFGLLRAFDYIVAEWHTNKDRMLAIMIEEARRDGQDLRPVDLLLIDDDPEQIYRGQCERMGARFACFGIEVHDLREVPAMLEAEEA